MKKNKNWYFIVIAALIFGVLMALREEVPNVLVRALIAGLAFAVVTLAIVSKRRDLAK